MRPLQNGTLRANGCAPMLTYRKYAALRCSPFIPHCTILQRSSQISITVNKGEY